VVKIYILSAHYCVVIKMSDEKGGGEAKRSNIKVDAIVKDTLESMKRGSESYNDVLKRKLELRPDVEDLLAFHPDDLRERAKEVIDHARSLLKDHIQEIDTEIVENKRDYDELRLSPAGENGLVIVKFKIGEDDMKIQYRNKDGEMRGIGYLFPSQETDMDKLKEKTDRLKEEMEKKIKGSCRRWVH